MFTWKTDKAEEWSYEKGVENGWIPKDPRERQFADLCKTRLPATQKLLKRGLNAHASTCFQYLLRAYWAQAEFLRIFYRVLQVIAAFIAQAIAPAIYAYVISLRNTITGPFVAALISIQK